MNSVFGIHVGNTTACLSICSDSFVTRVIATNAGDRVMPAMVTFLDDEIAVGTACNTLLLSRWKSTVISNKQTLDRDTAEDDSGRKAKIVVKDGVPCYELPSEYGVMYQTAVEVLSCIYQTLCSMAKEAVHREEVSCVLMVPEYFSETTRMKMKTAAEDAGWDVLQVITEPAAAVLGYNLLSEETLPPDQKILVYRAGGNSVDVSMIDLHHGMLTILGSEHSYETGGNCLVSIVTQYLSDEFYRRYKLDPRENHRSWTKLTQAAENCLHVLSTLESAKCFVESLCEGVDLDLTLSRARFESLLSPLLDKFASPLNSLFSRLDTSADKVSVVLLCGGLLKIPRLKKCISGVFLNPETQIVALPNGINYDEVLACGAARQAGYIASFNLRDSFLPTRIDIPTLEHPLTVQVVGGYVKNELSFEIPNIEDPLIVQGEDEQEINKANIDYPTIENAKPVQEEEGDVVNTSKSNFSIQSFEELMGIQNGGGDTNDLMVFEAGQPLPIRKPLCVSSSGEIIKLIFNQVISPQLVKKGVVTLDNLEYPAQLVLEIDKESIKVNDSSSTRSSNVVEMFTHNL